MITYIENKLKEIIVDRRILSRVGGGTVVLLTAKSGRQFILKTAAEPRRVQCEANGLRELLKTATLHVPHVYVDDGFLLIDYIAADKPKTGFFEGFGRDFAQMHRVSAASFGFYEDNFIGETEQKNIADNPLQSTSWLEFFMEKRLRFQYRLAEHNGYTQNDLCNAFLRLEPKIPAILGGSEEPPALLHGDLWNGNFIAGTDGRAWVIDPAVYYGHREADLAMTGLFGGFPPVFYEAYQECYPLQDGYERRKKLYELYHVLNHLNIFGEGYYRQALGLMHGLLSGP